MGKFQSKLALKRRQSPEGGSPASSVLTCQGEQEQIHIHKGKLTENLYVELRENKSDHNCNLKVVLPPKKTPDKDKSNNFQVNKRTKKKKSHAGDPLCDLVLEEDSQQEWVFTLYNFDNSGRVEDMSSLIQSMYEILEESVRQPCGDNTPLKIKLTVTPLACPDKSSQTAATEKKQRVSQEVGSPVTKLYCVNENIERRNHYLDLAGIENYSSKFDNSEPPCQETTHKAHSALEHYTVVARESCIFPQSPRSLSILHSLKSKHMPLGKDRSRGEGKSCRLHGHHTQSHLPAHSVRTHSKRLRSRVPDASSPLRHPGSQVQPAGDMEIPHKRQPSCGTPLAQRHDHHHHHEHHHHHHHHYHPS